MKTLTIYLDNSDSENAGLAWRSGDESGPLDCLEDLPPLREWDEEKLDYVKAFDRVETAVKLYAVEYGVAGADWHYGPLCASAEEAQASYDSAELEAYRDSGGLISARVVEATIGDPSVNDEAWYLDVWSNHGDALVEGTSEEIYVEDASAERDQ